MELYNLEPLLNRVISGVASVANKAQCLRLAIEQDNLTAIEIVLDHGVDPYFILPGQRVPIIYHAAKSSSDNVECLKFLLDHLMNHVIEGEASDDIRAVGLCLAIKQDNLTAIRILLDLGADPYFTILGEPLPVIHLAVGSNSDNVECLQLLQEHWESNLADGAFASRTVQNSGTREAAIQIVLNPLLQLASGILDV